VNRGNLIDTFGVSVHQSSTESNRYLSLVPDNMEYDKSAKTYVRKSGFEPQFLKPDASCYLSQLRSMGKGIIDASDSWIGTVPDFNSAPTPARGVNEVTLGTVVAAIRRKEEIEVKCQPLSQPEPRWRWIAPHAIGFDGFRWHARAFCLTDELFKDFLLTRILETRGAKPSDVAQAADLEWNEDATLKIGPHPDLSESQQKILALDYGMRCGRGEHLTARRRLLAKYRTSIRSAGVASSLIMPKSGQ
jgi:hypothetical protein